MIDILILIIGLYMAGSAIYNLFLVKDTNGYIVNSVSIVVGGILIYTGYSGTCPSPPSLPTLTGGRRRY